MYEFTDSVAHNQYILILIVHTMYEFTFCVSGLDLDMSINVIYPHKLLLPTYNVKSGDPKTLRP